MSTRAAVVAFALTLALSAHARDADACGNATRAELDGNTKRLKDAHRALDAGDNARAKRLSTPIAKFYVDVAEHRVQVDGMLTVLEDPTKVGPEDRVVAVDPSLLRRAVRIHALATVRTPGVKLDEKKDVLARFEKHTLDKSGEPTLMADYAELLSHFEDRHGAALMILRSLSSKDLLGSAEAYAALARLEKKGGAADASAAALERCKKMTTRAAAVCKA